jgi:radical SAM protein with 4Fe4S-binding SPASM domain
MLSPSRQRFALRREHFGGLLLDYRANSYEILTLEEYEILLGWLRAGGALSDARVLPDTLKRLEQKFGANELQVGNVRPIAVAENLPPNCLSAPVKVYDTCTRRCNLSCEHCYSLSNKEFIEVRRTLEQTRTIMRKFYETGVMEWQFTGGEPTIVPELIESIQAARDLGMRVTLNTNGCWPEKVGDMLIRHGVSSMIVSLEGTEETNDRRRGRGTHRRVIRSLSQIARYNALSPSHRISVTVNMTIGRDNLSDVAYVIRLAAASGFNVNFVPLKVTGRASSSMQDTMLSTAEYMVFVGEVQRLREEPEIKSAHVKLGVKHKDLYCSDYPDRSDLPCPIDNSECQALTVAVGLLPDGRVFACPFLMDHSEFIGPSVLTSSIYEAWLHPALQRFRQAVKVDCLDCCFYKERCRGKCRATVLLDGGAICDGSLVGDDRYCFRHLLPSGGI